MRKSRLRRVKIPNFSSFFHGSDAEAKAAARSPGPLLALQVARYVARDVAVDVVPERKSYCDSKYDKFKSGDERRAKFKRS